MTPRFRHPSRDASGHTLVELVVAMVISTFLLAGLGSVMLIARQIAYTPSAAIRRTQSADAINQMADELRYATLILQQTSRSLEFLVNDRNADGTSEKIRYEWSGTAGDPLYKTMNGGTPVAVIQNVLQFQLDYTTVNKTTPVTTSVDTAEATLVSLSSGSGNATEAVSTSNWLAQHIDPQSFPASVGGVNRASATSWNATRVDFQANNSQPLTVGLRETGETNGPTNIVLNKVDLASANANTATFSPSIRGLSFARKYAVVFRSDSASAANVVMKNLSGARTAFRSADREVSWQLYPDRQAICTVYGRYTAPGATYNVSRNYVADVRVALRAGTQSHARIDAQVPLINLPEVLSAYWRADFDANPTTTNANGDAVSDWALASGTFDAATLSGGMWNGSAALETRPVQDFTNVTTVSVRCRNTTVGGNGAVLRINADRQAGQYGPLLVYVQKQSDGTQTLTLYGKSSDANTTKLFERTRLLPDFVRYQLTIFPQNNVVNLTINREDQGTYSYPTYAPAGTSDRFLTVYTNTSQSEFDYIEARVGTN
jgi:Tfp pilus assembly protein PilW